MTDAAIQRRNPNDSPPRYSGMWARLRPAAILEIALLLYSGLMQPASVLPGKLILTCAPQFGALAIRATRWDKRWILPDAHSHTHDLGDEVDHFAI